MPLWCMARAEVAKCERPGGGGPAFGPYRELGEYKGYPLRPEEYPKGV
ncbi:hypothetical protein LIP_2176 [Limnochorda pilosa]|uniref:Uncharacterized protein n=1 Tax=Limnochorda pilosa TaxID=1555112 RepID=A0A0K2SLX9_LIMPI|nr:hypothetical protein LIP_2176 [Limnochorda pilosa]